MTVRIQYTKWDGSEHWGCETVRTADDEWGTWLYSPTGTRLVRPGAVIVTEAPSITVVSTQAAFTPTFWALDLAPAHLTHRVYVDMTTLPRWTDAATVTSIDLDLDVVLMRDGRVELLDEDEFAEHRERFGYPADVVDLAATTAARVYDDLTAEREPYATVGWRRLREAIDAERQGPAVD